MSGILPFVLLLGVLIFVHELGHFSVAKFFGVRVETFSIGFGKKLFSKKHGDTTYALSLIPLGGYVKMYGDDPTKEVPEDQKRYSFLHQPVWPRIWIVAAGPLVNFFFAILVFAIIAFVGEDRPGPEIGDILPGTAAYEAGFRSGDVITAVNPSVAENTYKVNDYTEIKDVIESNPERQLTFLVDRDGESEAIAIKATPKLMPNRNIISFYSEVGHIEGLTILSNSSAVGVSDPQSLAGKAGLKNLSVIKSINGEPVEYWRNLDDKLKAAFQTGAQSQVTLEYVDYQDKSEDPEMMTATIDSSDVSASTLALEGEGFLNAIGIHEPDTFLAGVKRAPSLGRRFLRALGFEVPEDIENASPAYKAGLREGDQIVGINGNPVKEWGDVLTTVGSFKSEDKQLDFTIKREGEEQSLTVTPQMTTMMSPQGKEIERFTIGIYSAGAATASPMFVMQTYNPIKALYYGAYQSVRWTGLTIISFVRLIEQKVSVKNVGGVITIGRVASQSFEMGLSAFLKIMGIISINLFILNLLPIPVLDGGHLVFFTYEAIRGAPLSLRKMEIAQTVGIVLLMSLMLFALFNDVNNWYSVQGW